MRPLSARNPRIARLTKLVKRPGERSEQRALVVEGPTLLGAALDAGAAVREVYVDEAALDRPLVAEVLARLPESLDPWELPAGVLDRVGDVATSQGILAIVDHEVHPFPAAATAPFVVVLVDLQIPGNVGTLVRAAAAAGADAVVVAGGADPTSPKVVRASAGSCFTVPVVTTAAADVVDRLRGAGYRVAASVVAEGVDHDRADLRGPIAVLLGSEAHGLPAPVVAGADLAVTIATSDAVESLNVAMAGTVLAFEVHRQARQR